MRSKFQKNFDEEPDYTRQKKEICVDPTILQKVVAEVGNKFTLEEKEIRNAKIRAIWKRAKKILAKQNPERFLILHMKYYLGMSEPEIAKHLKISQPWVRGSVLSAVNQIRKAFGLPSIKKIVENENMVRDKTKFKKHFIDVHEELGITPDETDTELSSEEETDPSESDAV